MLKSSGGAGNRTRCRSQHELTEAGEVIDVPPQSSPRVGTFQTHAVETLSSESGTELGTGRRRGNHAPTLDWLRSQCQEEPCSVVGLKGPCWIWQKAITDDGYGRANIEGKTVVAHRVAYEVARGAVFCWLTLDHLCRVRACINPDHQEPVTQQVNIARGESPSAVAHRTGVCQCGHPLTAIGGRFRCKVCQAARQRDWYERKCAADGKPAPESRPRSQALRDALDRAATRGPR